LKVGSAGDGPEGGGADRRPVTGERLALSLGAEPVAVAADGQHVAVVQEPVEIAVATTGSANTVPHAATLRFDVISMAPVS
jgi:hypothetical protein